MQQDGREEGVLHHPGTVDKACHPNGERVSFLHCFLRAVWLHLSNVLFVWARTPLDLALAVTDVASRGSFTFRRTRTSAIDRDEEEPKEDLGLYPTDTERVAWRARNKAEEELVELEVAPAQSWARAVEARERATAEPAWRRCRRAQSRRR